MSCEAIGVTSLSFLRLNWVAVSDRTTNAFVSWPGVYPAQPPQGQFFNPYNLPADWVPPTPVPADSGTPVEPDRAKYANPYNPQPPE